MKAEEAYALAKSYTKKTAAGMGAVKGAAAQVQGITDNADGTHTVTFAWQDNTGQSHTSTMTVSDGKDGKGIAGVTQSADGKSITVVFDDGTMSSPMLIPTEKGDNGKSAYEVAVENGFSGTQADWLASLKGDEGEAGFSPEITVKENTQSKYILHIKTADDEFDSPNLKSGSGGGGEETEELTTEQVNSLLSKL